MLGTAFTATLASAQAGDEAAFAALFRDVQPVLIRYLRVLAPPAAEDVASETWLQVVTGLHGFSGEERSFRAWVFTIARHRAIDWARAKKRRPTVPLSEMSVGVMMLPDPADVVEERMSTRALLSSIATLPGDQAEIILLRVLGGLATEDVARLVNKSPGAVRVAAHRGLRRLAGLVDMADVTA
jgi:RNA polymerase sigma-70 factor, ECF subfamily